MGLLIVIAVIVLRTVLILGFAMTIIHYLQLDKLFDAYFHSWLSGCCMYVTPHMLSVSVLAFVTLYVSLFLVLGPTDSLVWKSIDRSTCWCSLRLDTFQ